MQGDWYGLRFLAILSIGQNVEVHYNPEAKKLEVPITQRFPELYESYLVMALGLLPTYDSHLLIYERISLQLATELTIKLNITF